MDIGLIRSNGGALANGDVGGSRREVSRKFGMQFDVPTARGEVHSRPVPCDLGLGAV